MQAAVEPSRRGLRSARTTNLIGAIIASLEIAALTVLGMLVLLVPTMTWTYIRVPRMQRAVEFLCLLPLAIPAIVLVVGIAPIYSVLTRVIGGTPLSLVFIDIILVLPFAHRAIDAGLKSIDVNTLAEAARSLGAGWPRIMLQIIVPNIRGAIVSASVITVALVLGEFTISSLLNFDTLQVVINLLGKRNAFVSVAVSLAALLFAFVLILGLASVGPRRRQAADDSPRKEPPDAVGPTGRGHVVRSFRGLGPAAGSAPSLRVGPRPRWPDARHRAR